MSTKRFGLDRLQELERVLEETYRWLAEVFIDDGEASELFASLADEEGSHARLVGHEIQLLASDTEAAVLEIDGDEIDELFRLLADLKAAEGAPRLDEAVATALLVESSGAESYAGAVVVSARPAINEMIGKLAQANLAHEARLHAFAEARNFLVWVEED